MVENSHSEEYFGDYRDYWYNYDFLELMSKRWKLDKVNSLLDIGCGMCHWSRLLANFLPENSSVFAVDSDDKWSLGSEEIRQDFIKKKIDFKICKGDIYALPFADNSFDAVTCQTVLIHLADPKLALQEMKRVLKSGGIMICAEPNNLTESLIKNSLTASDQVDKIIANVTYSLVYEKGYQLSGGGDISIGDLMPGLLKSIGLEDIKCYLSDKTNMIIPPYNTPEMKAFIDMKLEEHPFEDKIDEYTKKYFACFDAKYDYLLEKHEEEKIYKAKLRESIQNHTYHESGGFMMYLVSGRK